MNADWTVEAGEAGEAVEAVEAVEADRREAVEAVEAGEADRREEGEAGEAAGPNMATTTASAPLGRMFATLTGLIFFQPRQTMIR